MSLFVFPPLRVPSALIHTNANRKKLQWREGDR